VGQCSEEVIRLSQRTTTLSVAYFPSCDGLTIVIGGIPFCEFLLLPCQALSGKIAIAVPLGVKLSDKKRKLENLKEFFVVENFALPHCRKDQIEECFFWVTLA
jgi:hypothetical protein